MELAEIRTKIDETDREIRELLLKRMGYSHQVAEAKVKSGDTTIYRADREASILENLGDTVDPEVRSEYLSVVRKIMETSRMYQYGLIFDWTPDAFEGIKGHELVAHAEALQGSDLRSPSAQTDSNSQPDSAANEAGLSETSVTVRLTRENKPNAMSAILSMIGDYGYNMDRMVPVTEGDGGIKCEEVAAPENAAEAKKKDTVTFDLTILGNLAETNMKKLMFQLDGESINFEILACK